MLPIFTLENGSGVRSKAIPTKLETQPSDSPRFVTRGSPGWPILRFRFVWRMKVGVTVVQITLPRHTCFDFAVNYYPRNRMLGVRPRRSWRHARTALCRGSNGAPARGPSATRPTAASLVSYLIKKYKTALYLFPTHSLSVNFVKSVGDVSFSLDAHCLLFCYLLRIDQWVFILIF